MRDSKIKVLNFMISDSFGGIETYLSGAYKMMDKEKIQMDFVASDDEAGTVKQFRKMGATVHIVPSARNIFSYINSIKGLLDLGYDVAYFHKNSAANIIPIEIAVRKKCKIIVHSHNVAPSRGRITKLLHNINRAKMNRLTDYRFACSMEAAEWMFGRTKDCLIINNGIDTERFRYNEKTRSRIRAGLGISQSDFVVGCVGRFVGFKNQRWLIENLKFNAEDTRLLLVGDGECLEDCKRLAGCVDNPQNIIFAGARTDIPEVLSAMDMFIVPSIYEGFGIAAIEAQASGLLTYISEGVPETALLTAGTKRFSLDRDGAKMLQRALDDKRCIAGADRAGYCEAVKEKGFDIRESYGRVERVIRKMCND